MQLPPLHQDASCRRHHQARAVRVCAGPCWYGSDLHPLTLSSPPSGARSPSALLLPAPAQHGPTPSLTCRFAFAGVFVAVQVGLSAETGKMLVLGHQLVAPPIDPSTGQVQPRPEARCCPAPFARLRVRLRIPTRTVGIAPSVIPLGSTSRLCCRWQPGTGSR